MVRINIENGKWELHTMAAWSRAPPYNIHIDSVLYYCQAVSFGPGSAEVANELVACRQDILIYYVRLRGETTDMERHFHIAWFGVGYIFIIFLSSLIFRLKPQRYHYRIKSQLWRPAGTCQACKFTCKPMALANHFKISSPGMETRIA